MSSRILIPAATIAERVRELGQTLTASLQDVQAPLLIGVLDGACCFVADLARQINSHGIELRFIRASSYTGTTSAGAVKIEAVPPCAGRTVILVDDILDTGRTLHVLVDRIRGAGASRVISCVLLDKPARRVVPFTADHVGFPIADHFVVGYGLDHDGRYRHLPDIMILNAG